MYFETINLKYGSKTEVVKMQKQNLLDILNIKPIPAVFDEKEAVLQAIRNPIASPGLKEIIKKGEEIVIIASDITRSVRNQVVIPALVEELENLGISHQNITIVVATGTHRGHTKEEFMQMFTPEIVEKVKIIDHCSKEKDQLAYLGQTSRGTPVWINRKVAAADRTIITGGIVYHSMAGFGGGRKSICPGVSGFETIQHNHKLMLNPPEKGGGLKPSVGCGKVQGNPLSEDMEEIADMISPDFMVNVILNSEGKIAKVVAGDYREAFKKGCDLVREFFSLKVQEKADAVFLSCGGYPKDIDLYQATKAIENSAGAVRDGGVIVLAAECFEGVGYSDFYNIVGEFSTRKQREEELWKEFTVAKGVGYILTLILEKKSVILVSKLQPEIVSKMGMIPAENLNSALKMVNDMLGDNFRSYVVPNASSSVLTL